MWKVTWREMRGVVVEEEVVVVVDMIGERMDGLTGRVSWEGMDWGLIIELMDVLMRIMESLNGGAGMAGIYAFGRWGLRVQ